MVDDFDRDVDTVIEQYEKIIGQFATRTKQMIENYGKIEALSRLVMSPKSPQGFKVLRDNGMLDKTFEALVVKYENKFSLGTVKVAKYWLDHPYER